MRVIVLAPLAMAACTQDFDVFLANGDASTDDSTNDVVVSDGNATDQSIPDSGSDSSVKDAAVDAPPETSCTPNATCITAAQSCGTACGQTSATCQAACSNNPCKNQCKNVEATCRNGCDQACVTCTTDAGCADPTDCLTASHS